MPEDEQPPDPASDPYYLWAGLEPEAALPFSQVRDGLTCYLRGKLKWSWDNLTRRKTDWHLAREKGLTAWCRSEATRRLGECYRPTYTAGEFHELHFTEAMRRGGKKALQDPIWSPLLLHKQLEGDVGFIQHIAILVNQPPIEFHAVMRQFCVYWDREVIPLEFWSYSAIGEYFHYSLRADNLLKLAPFPNTVKQWVNRLELRQGYPQVVTGFNPLSGIRFDYEAFNYHQIPPPPDGYTDFS